MNISFGKKVPIMQCKVVNTKTMEYIPATIFEYDCKDKTDADDINAIDGYWFYKNEIFFTAKDKIQFPKKKRDIRIFSLENNKGKTIGLMQCSKNGNQCDVNLLEKRFLDKHKYVGSVLLAAAAKETLKSQADKLTVSSPVPEARDFYINGCGFKATSTKNLEMNQEQIEKFIKQTEQKTNSPIINLQG